MRIKIIKADGIAYTANGMCRFCLAPILHSFTQCIGSLSGKLTFGFGRNDPCVFLSSRLYVTGRLYATPLGFDTEHVYRVKLASIPPGGKEYKPGDTDSLKIEQWFSILSRLRAYPGVEAVSLSIGSHPYNQNSSSGSRGIDTTWVHGYVYNVSPAYVPNKVSDNEHSARK